MKEIIQNLTLSVFSQYPCFQISLAIKYITLFCFIKDSRNPRSPLLEIYFFIIILGLPIFKGELKILA